jgi:flagellar motor protein MotB
MGPKGQRGPQDTIDISRIDYNRALDINYLNAIFDRLREGEPALAQVTAQNVSGRLVVSLPQALLFEAGRADISGEGAEALYTLGGKLSKIRNRIEIIGHTDPDAISEDNDRYNSNWELSLARSLNVAAALRKVGYDRPLTVRGMGSALYAGLPETLAQDERMAMARRVDLVIMDDDGTLNSFNGLGIQ